MTRLLPAICLLAATACDPYRSWPDDAETVYPYVYTPETDLESYADVRWETETWDPADDLAMAAQYLLKAQNHRPGAPDEVLAHFRQQRQQVPTATGQTRLSFVGDIMWVGGNWDGFLDPVAPLLDGDLRLGNLETPTSPDHPTELGSLGLYAFNAPPEMLDGLPLDVVQLNNNHSTDADDAGLEATLDGVTARGMTPVGVDAHATVAAAGLDVAVLSYTWGLNRRDYASAHELFVVPFGHVGERIDLTELEVAVAGARHGADAVVVMLHWGFEYEYYPDPHFQQLARSVVAAGADVVVGQGPHVVQPVEICHVNQSEHVPGVGTCAIRTEDELPRNAAVIYSLGNFGTAMPTVPAKVGVVVSVELDPDVVGLDWAPVYAGDDPMPLVIPAEDADDDEIEAELQRLATHLGEGWRR